MSRIERFRGITRRTAIARAPWAARVVTVGGIHIAYQDAMDAEEEHGRMSRIKPLWDSAQTQPSIGRRAT